MKFAITDNHRDSQYELLRIVAMVMIVLHHIVFHAIPLMTTLGDSYRLNTSLPSAASNVLFLLETFVIYGVNLFILISGYYSIKISLRKFLSLYLLICSYNLINLFLMFVCGMPVTFLDALHAMMPFSHSHSWFVKAYLYLFFLSPILNYFIRRSSRIVFGMSILVCAAMICIIGFFLDFPPFTRGYNAWQFLLLYMIGRYLRLYVSADSYPQAACLIKSCLCSLSVFCLFLVVQNCFSDCPTFPFRLLWYNNPVILLGSIYLFLSFRSMHFHSRYINWIASSVLSVYLIQEGAELIFSADVYRLLGSVYQYSIWIFVPLVVLYVIQLFAVSVLLDHSIHFIIQRIFKLLHL